MRASDAVGALTWATERMHAETWTYSYGEFADGGPEIVIKGFDEDRSWTIEVHGCDWSMKDHARGSLAEAQWYAERVVRATIAARDLVVS
jgi:hypothetical protein